MAFPKTHRFASFRKIKQRQNKKEVTLEPETTSKTGQTTTTNKHYNHSSKRLKQQNAVKRDAPALKSYPNILKFEQQENNEKC